jgi:transcriptional regulator with XRE-family HTH domain
MSDRGTSSDLGEDTPDAPYVPDITTKSAIDLPATVGSNLRRLRARMGYSLKRLASVSGVSRGMIGQIETGKSIPTVGLLSRLAEALDVELVSLLVAQQAPTTTILRRARAKTIQTSDGRFTARALSKRDTRGVEFFEFSIARAHYEEGDRRAPGVRAHVVVAAGIVAVSIAGEPVVTLAAGDGLIFAADAAHGYHNVGDDEATLYLVLSDGGAPA